MIIKDCLIVMYVIKFYTRRKTESDEDKDFADDTDIPF